MTVPKLNSDGTPLRDLAGFNIYHSQEVGLCKAEGVLPAVVLSDDQNAYIFENLPSGLHYFSITAYDENNNESACSAEVSIDL